METSQATRNKIYAIESTWTVPIHSLVLICMVNLHSKQSYLTFTLFPSSWLDCSSYYQIIKLCIPIINLLFKRRLIINPEKECVELDLIGAKADECVKGLIGRNERGDVKDRKINKVVMNTVLFIGLQGKSTNFDIVSVDCDLCCFLTSV